MVRATVAPHSSWMKALDMPGFWHKPRFGNDPKYATHLPGSGFPRRLLELRFDQVTEFFDDDSAIN
jgi:hypothetical protein